MDQFRNKKYRDLNSSKYIRSYALETLYLGSTFEVCTGGGGRKRISLIYEHLAANSLNQQKWEKGWLFI